MVNMLNICVLICKVLCCHIWFQFKAWKMSLNKIGKKSKNQDMMYNNMIVMRSHCQVIHKKGVPEG